MKNNFTFIHFHLKVSRKTEVDITNIVQALCIGDSKVSIKVEPCMEMEQKNMKLEHLISIFESLFKCRNACFILRKLQCWLLLTNGNDVFLFDPIGLEYPGKKKSYHRATLYRFESIRNAMIQLTECINETLNEEEASSLIVIGCIDVKMMEKKNAKIRKEKRIVKKTNRPAEITEQKSH